LVATAWLRRRAENVAAALLLVMFMAFLCQIVLRYLVGANTGWAYELSIITWLWLVLWGAAFVVGERDEIRFDIIYGLVRPSIRRAFAAVSGVALIVLYGISLPAIYDYVAFMKVEKTAYLGIRIDLLYSVYVLFAGAAIVRYVWLVWRSLRGEVPQSLIDPAQDADRDGATP
jgi:TRAP-type C4-dicarboxylate transport system permease small subunit